MVWWFGGLSSVNLSGTQNTLKNGMSFGGRAKEDERIKRTDLLSGGPAVSDV